MILDLKTKKYVPKPIDGGVEDGDCPADQIPDPAKTGKCIPKSKIKQSEEGVVRSVRTVKSTVYPTTQKAVVSSKEQQAGPTTTNSVQWAKLSKIQKTLTVLAFPKTGHSEPMASNCVRQVKSSKRTVSALKES